MLNAYVAATPEVYPIIEPASASIAYDLSNLRSLNADDLEAVTEFLAKRPVHTVVMSSFIADNGIESELNRGIFYGYFDEKCELEGVALIGHSTLIEARSDRSLRAFALKARESRIPINLIMSDDDVAERFFELYAIGQMTPRLKCTELLFQTDFPFPVQKCEWHLREARPENLDQVARAQAEVAFIESGIDPMSRDREGFLKRCARRIEQGRVFVVFDGDQLVFKADIIAEASDVIYLEGVYVAPGFRGRGVGTACLSEVCRQLLGRAMYVCLLSNVEAKHAHRSFANAGLRNTGKCTTLFL